MRLLLGLVLLVGCGQEKPHIKYVEAPPVETPTQPTPGGGGTGDTVTYNEMQTLLDQYCSQCHSSAPFMQNEANLRRSTAQDRIWSRNMPPANAANELGKDDRKKMLLFFQ
jgi:hypothetical protein